jgi:PBP1b-binding outer membrane lipoprotein LpoB
MKTTITVLALALSIASCTNDTNKEVVKADSSSVKKDSLAKDTFSLPIQKVDTTKVDTTKHK